MSSMNYQSTKKVKCDFTFFFIFNGLSATENDSTPRRLYGCALNIINDNVRKYSWGVSGSVESGTETESNAGAVVEERPLQPPPFLPFIFAAG